MRLVQCPSCGFIGEAYEQQIKGDQSLVCSRCGWHGYSDRHMIPTKLPLIDIERFMPDSPRYSPYSL